MASQWTNTRVYAPLPQVERGYATVISGHQDKDACLYANGKCIIKRSLSNPYDCETLFMHTLNVGVARFSPDGKWIASGDAGGTVKVFSSEEDRKVMNDLPVIGGKVTDLQWAPDGKKIMAVGEGRGQVAKCFAWDRGSNFGEFDGLSRKVNSCDFRPTSPFRIVTGSEDCKVNVYSGPPFKFTKSNTKHTNFVNCVRYSPDGARFVSVSSDKKCAIYDGETGELIQEFGMEKGEAHTGSIMSCAWSPDSSTVITAANDKTVKVWDIATLKLKSTIKLGSDLEDMQVGCTWIGDYPLSLSLSGHLNYLDVKSGSVRTQIKGHTKPLTTMAADPLGGSETFFTASYDGKVAQWDASEGCKSTAFVHSNKPVRMHLANAETVVSVGFDDTLRATSLPLKGKDTAIKTTKLEAQPRDSSHCKASGSTVVIYEKKVELLKDGSSFCSLDLSYDATACAISPDGNEVAIGSKSGKVFTFALKSGTLEASKTLERHRGEISSMAYSHDSSMLATGDSIKEILIWDTAKGEVKKSRMVYHSSRITSISWSPDNACICSGSIDSSIIVWPLDLPTSKRTSLPLAHLEGVQGVSFLSETKMASVGGDGICKVWEKTA